MGNVVLKSGVFIVFFTTFILALQGCVEKVMKEDVSNMDKEQNSKEGQMYEKATFAAGCFWGVQAAFQSVTGVIDTSVGYSGGNYKDPTYKDVCTDRTGHAEVVRVIFDPNVVSYDKLLEVFWSIHDPTTPNRQGPDAGSQYRSAVFFHDQKQMQAAQLFKERLGRSGKFNRPIVTEIVPASAFYRAEEYHQKYFEKHGMPSCHVKIQ